MAGQERIRRTAATTSTPETAEARTEADPETAVKGETLKAEIDELLDDIDEILEHNEVSAAEFLAAYVQGGGQ